MHVYSTRSTHSTVDLQCRDLLVGLLGVSRLLEVQLTVSNTGVISCSTSYAATGMVSRSHKKDQILCCQQGRKQGHSCDSPKVVFNVRQLKATKVASGRRLVTILRISGSGLGFIVLDFCVPFPSVFSSTFIRASLYLYLLDTVQYSIGKYQVSTIWRVIPPLDPNLADTPRTKSLTISHLID
jgi:hypothetical protein